MNRLEQQIVDSLYPADRENFVAFTDITPCGAEIVIRDTYDRKEVYEVSILARDYLSYEDIAAILFQLHKDELEKVMYELEKMNNR